LGMGFGLRRNGDCTIKKMILIIFAVWL
jgi:hypothetical protein